MLEIIDLPTSEASKYCFKGLKEVELQLMPGYVMKENVPFAEWYSHDTHSPFWLKETGALYAYP